ncbi:MAG TPA: nickel pincer cofactor biosynthesis protein LarB [Gemmatimonadaceae bacterium]|nr:nickel pincer cofactor biosynthesis protein LarB [Gemmatimonadaceae bacterium]
MRRERVRALLQRVAEGSATIEEALGRLDIDPVETLPFAQLDHHRALRHGYPEVVFGDGKSAEQTVQICERLAARGDGFLVTRTSGTQRAALSSRFPEAAINELARTVRKDGRESRVESRELESGVDSRELEWGVENRESGAKRRAGRSVLIVTAGTADLPVAEEAAETLTAVDLCFTRLTDVGVAGIHRVLANGAALGAAAVIIVVAGMDGALPSVIGGLVRAPVIAVPTSVGYGASFTGLAALLTMLNSCAAGVTVCNIDNGFGAAMAASRILGA